MDGKLTDQDMDQLEKWIGTGPKLFNLIYSIKRDGGTGSAFHQKCDNQGPTVTVFYNQQESVYGGYASSNWNSSGSYLADSKAFLFQLRFSGKPKQTLFPINQSQAGYALYGPPGYGPTFGNGHDIIAFHAITINASGGVFPLNGYMQIGTTYNNQGVTTNQINNGTMIVTDLEVYKVTVGERILTEPWRVMPTWNNQTFKDLQTYVNNVTPQSENVSKLRILMIGPVGAGKSSFCNTIISIYKNRIAQNAFCGSAEQSVTTAYTPYLIQTQSGSTLNFRICDTRGLEENMGLDVSECNYLLDGHVPELYKFNPVSPITPETNGFVVQPTLEDKVHCAVFVVDSTTFDVLPGKILQKMKNIMTLMIQKDIPVIIILTKIDNLCRYVAKDISNVIKSIKVKNVVDIAAQRFGLPRSNIFPVKNYEHEVQLNESINILTLYTLRQILYFAQDYLENVRMKALCINKGGIK